MGLPRTAMSPKPRHSRIRMNDGIAERAHLLPFCRSSVFPQGTLRYRRWSVPSVRVAVGEVALPAARFQQATEFADARHVLLEPVACWKNGLQITSLG